MLRPSSTPTPATSPKEQNGSSSGGVFSGMSNWVRGSVAAAAVALSGVGCGDVPSYCKDKVPVDIDPNGFIMQGRYMALQVDYKDPGDLCRFTFQPEFHARMKALCTVEGARTPSTRTFYTSETTRLPFNNTSETLIGLKPDACQAVLKVNAEWDTANGLTFETRSINVSDAQPQPRP